MRKISYLFFMVLMMALSTSLAMAGRYNSLKFTSNSGETYTVAASNLEILVDSEKLTFNNTDLTIPLSSLVSMEFTDDGDNPAEIDTVISGGNEVITVYNISGTPVGSFDSYAEALASLSQGVYVIKDANGNSLKIRVGK